MLSITLLFQTLLAGAQVDVPMIENDPHRNEMGFFDIHVCNWPDRPVFFKTLFSSTKYDDIQSMEMFHPDGTRLGDLDLRHFMKIDKKGKPYKRVFMKDIPVPENSTDGWYTITVTSKSGKQYTAKDYVVMTRLPRPTGMNPPDGAEDVPMPTELTWDPVPGAKHYQVYIRDAFENKMILSSKLLNEPRIKIKPGLFEPGGVYSWSIHSRDVNENVILGDFNIGSLSDKSIFSIADE
jgi:hypothetical protein